MKSPGQILDEALVLAAQAGRAEAFEALAERWHPRLLRHARRLSDGPDAARDAAQEAWVAIAKGLPRLRDAACFGAWALRITTRRCADAVDRARITRLRERVLESVEEDRANAVPGMEEGAVATEVLRRLDPADRALLGLYYLEGLTVVEVAHALDVPAGTVKSRLFSVRARVRALLEVHHDP
jgi:RNA polymerase sigma-70 factor (ECF subfamily)